MYNAILQVLESSSITYTPRVMDLVLYGQSAFRVKIRATVTAQLTFQIWLNHNPSRTRYAYQLSGQEETLLRWDNAPHHPQITTNYPHHFHNAQGSISPSRLQGTPLQDLPVVLEEIEKHLSHA